MNKDLIEALNILEEEKGIEKEVILDGLRQAMMAAYKKDYGQNANIRVDIDEITGQISVKADLTVAEEVEDDRTQISLEDARLLNKAYEPGDIIEKDVTPKSFGRIAAQTAKQVVVQKIREAERAGIHDRYSDKENEMITGTVMRQERGVVYLNVGNAEAIIPAREAIPGEELQQNQRVKVYVMEVKNNPRGAQIITSRSHPGLLKRLFELEVPEIQSNAVVIKAYAREAGKRSKIAVYAEDPNIDPVGACVGSRGARINAVVEELGGERVDIVPWSEDPAEFIANSLRPAQVLMTRVNEDEKQAEAIVADSQLSLAIGKEGQNARLAAKLTGYKIDIKPQSQVSEDFFTNIGDIGADNETEEE